VVICGDLRYSGRPGFGPLMFLIDELAKLLEHHDVIANILLMIVVVLVVVVVLD